jgi:hypothetical protein
VVKFIFFSGDNNTFYFTADEFEDSKEHDLSNEIVYLIGTERSSIDFNAPKKRSWQYGISNTTLSMNYIYIKLTYKESLVRTAGRNSNFNMDSCIVKYNGSKFYFVHIFWGGGIVFKS